MKPTRAHVTFAAICAALSLCGLHRSEGKEPQVSNVLLPVYEWFTEGFSTPNLLEANEFLHSAKEY